MNRLTVCMFAAASFGWLMTAAQAEPAPAPIAAGDASIRVAADDAGTEVAPAEVAPVPIAALPADPDPNPFVPDVYPSREEAAKAAAARWAKHWGKGPGRVRVRSDELSDDPTLLLPVAKALRSRLRGAVVLVGEGEAGPNGEAFVSVFSTDDTVHVGVPGFNDPAAASARFVDKPWVANFAGFVGRTPGRWIVAHSDKDRPATAAADAARDARAAAVDQLTPLVAARFAPSERYDDGDIRRLVERHLLGDRLVVDRFPQKFERPYGSLFREAVLVDASDDRLEELAREMQGTLAAERRSRIGGLASAMAVLLVTYALYRFANAFTRGYFTWSLRTAAAVAAAGAVVLIVAVA